MADLLGENDSMVQTEAGVLEAAGKAGVSGGKGISDFKAELSSLSARTKLMPLRYKAELSSLSARTKHMPLWHKKRSAPRYERTLTVIPYLEALHAEPR
jgi:hypothetical protein